MDISIEQSTPSEHRQTKPGVKLPKTNEEWSIANEYFKCTFDLSKEITNVDYKLKNYKITYIIISNELMVQLTTQTTIILSPSDKDMAIYRKDNS